MRAFKVPLTPDNQIFDIFLGAQHYGIELRWNAEAKHWAIDISDYNTGIPLIQGIPLVSGCDLLEQFEYMGIPGQLIVTGDLPKEPPTYETIGTSSDLYFFSNEDYPYYG